MLHPGGVLGYKRDGQGGGGGGGPTEPYILNPKKYKTGDYSNHAFGSCGNFGLNCVRTISLAEIRTQKNTRRLFRLKKIHG